MLDGCEKLNVVNFKPVSFDLLDMTQIDLSTDQQYLYDIHLSARKLSEGLANKNSGKMAHSPWLTTANCISRLYVSTVEPSQTLKIIVKYITNVHAPVWFAIKNISQNGALLLFKTTEIPQVLIPDVRNIVYPVIQRNAFFAHPENLLLCMINDESSNIIQLGWRQIKKARKQFKRKTIRTFQILDLNFEAEMYFDMINWQKVNLTEPSLTHSISDDEINHLIIPKEKKNFPHLPCNTQAVERCVKLVTGASSLVCGQNSRFFVQKSNHVRKSQVLKQNKSLKFNC